MRLINKLLAAAIGYILIVARTPAGYFRVVDLGGGTFDFSVLYIKLGKGGDSNIFLVYSIAEDNRLSGEDFTNILVSKVRPYFLDEVSNTTLREYYKTVKIEGLSFR